MSPFCRPKSMAMHSTCSMNSESGGGSGFLKPMRNPQPLLARVTSATESHRAGRHRFSSPILGSSQMLAHPGAAADLAPEPGGGARYT